MFNMIHMGPLADDRTREPGLRVTEDDDTLAATGTIAITGSLVFTEADDTLAATGEVVTPPGVTATFTLQAISWDERLAAQSQGHSGPVRWGNYLAIPSDGAGTDYYVWETFADADGRFVGVDPGDFVAGLSGYTGIEVQHPAGARTAAQRATAIAAAVESSTPHTAVATDNELAVTGSIGTCSVGGMWGATNAGLIGNRRHTSSFAGAVISEGVGSFGVSPSGRTVIVRAIRVYVDVAGADMRAAVYTGGTSGSLTGTTLRAEVVVPDGATGMRTIYLTPDQVFSMASATNYRVVLKGAGGVAAPGYRVASSTGVDLDDLLEVYDTTDVVPNPEVAWPASLAAVSISTTYTISAMIALEYVDADGTSGEWETQWGTQIPDPTTLPQQSSLTVPDAGGADLFMGQDPPDVAGIRLRAHGLGYGEYHSTQLRLFVAQGGTIGDAAGATVIWQSMSSGSTTQAWVETAANDAAIDTSQVLWWGVRNNNTGVTFRFAFNANFDAASPDDNPSDFVATSEYEIFRSVNGDGTGGNVYTTDPATSVASPVATNGGFVATNTNHPAAYLVLYLPADSVA